MEHIIRFFRGHDCIDFECAYGSKNCAPGEGGSHGKSSVTIVFAVKGEKGAINFSIYSGWLPVFQKQDDIGSYSGIKFNSGSFMPADLGYHAKEPQYEGQTVCQESCLWLDGAPCYYDGSGLAAYEAMYTLVNGGDDELWKYLEDVYLARFQGGEHPKPYEYPYPKRVANER
jgi:hypothetical protein